MENRGRPTIAEIARQADFERELWEIRNLVPLRIAALFSLPAKVLAPDLESGDGKKEDPPA